MRSRLEKLIYNNTLFCALIFIPFVEPLYFTQLALLDTLFLYWKFAAFAVIIGAWILRGKTDKVYIGLLLFLLLDCIVTIVNKGNVSQMITNAITLFAMAILFGSAAENGSYKFVRVASTVFEILIFINFITIVLFPNGLYNFTAVNHHYFLGSRNVMMRTIFPGVCFSVLRSKIEKNKLGIHTLIVMIIAGASLILVWSATALAAYSLFCICLLLYRAKGTPKWFTVKACYVFSILVFLVIIVFQFQGLFSFMIVDALKKDLTFTGRTILWSSAMLNIAKSPILGYGLEYLQTIGPKLYRFTAYDSCHNFFLDVLYQNGIVGFALISILFVSVEKKVDHHISSRYRTIFILFIFAYSVMINFEPFINGDMRLFVSILFYLNYFNEAKLTEKSSDRHRRFLKLGNLKIER